MGPAIVREYIKDQGKVHDTNMIVRGVNDEKRTYDLLAFLKQFDATRKRSEDSLPLECPPAVTAISVVRQLMYFIEPVATQPLTPCLLGLIIHFDEF